MDTINRYISNANVRVAVAVTTQSVEEARFRHDLWPVATAALGRLMTGALLICNGYKNHETVSILVDGNGPLGKLHADYLANNCIRGYVDNPHVDLPLNALGKLDVGQAVGLGDLTVTRFTNMENNYTSQSKLVSGEIGDDLASYLLRSEQIASTISVGVLVGPKGNVEVAGGFIVQALPGAKDEDLMAIEENIRALGPVSTYLKEHPTGEGLAEAILKGFDCEKLLGQEVAFGCTCTRERFKDALTRLNDKDKEEILQDDTTELVCHYCNTAYSFPKAELEEAFGK